MKALVFAFVCPALLALCPMLLLFAASSATPETTMSEKKLEDLELRYLEWRVEYGENLPAGVNKHPWRNLSATMTQGRLNIYLTGGAPSLVWYGEPGREERDELKALADRLLRESDEAWPGGMERSAFDDLGRKDKARLCVWNLIAMYNEPGGRDIVREIRFQGADKGDNPERLAFETPLAAHVEALVRRLHATAPKTPCGIHYSGADADGAFFYSLATEDEGQIRVSRMRRGKNEESEVDPAVHERVTDIARRHGTDAWNGFVPPGWDRKKPEALELTLNYDTGQSVWVRGLRGADRALLPAGFEAFERELLAALDEALDGPPNAQAQSVAPRQGLKRLLFTESGMSYDSHFTYRVGTRREAGRDVFRLMRRQANRIAECALSDADMAALEALLVKRNVAKWNGFSGNAKNVLDGDSFSLSLEFTDGRTVSAGGYMRFPKGYREARDEIWRFLDDALAKSGAETRELRR